MTKLQSIGQGKHSLGEDFSARLGVDDEAFGFQMKDVRSNIRKDFGHFQPDERFGEIIRRITSVTGSAAALAATK